MKLALLAGTQSGCGKTTIMLALLQFLKVQQRVVTPFKSGPDFLDPLWHQAVTGRLSYNIDTRMIGSLLSMQLISEQSQGADVALIEGVMGLFDGRSGVGGSGSSAELAKVLNAPVFLVINAQGMSGSIVPMVSGYVDYAQKMGSHIVGIIANRVGSVHHAKLLSEALQAHDQPPLIAWMEKDAPILPERHLGLVQPTEANLPDFLPFFHVEVEDLSLLFTSGNSVTPNKSEEDLLGNKRMAIARDAASCFIYPANLDFLREQGAELFFFSPLKGEAVPEHADALWLPGGYPELFAKQLSQSNSWESIRVFIEEGFPTLAECGGAMLLGDALIDQEGIEWPMAKLLPYRSKMQSKLASLGYREEASGLRGHEFHHSTRETLTAFDPCFDLDRGDKGIRYKNLRASYIHWYFASAPEVIAEWFKHDTQI